MAGCNYKISKHRTCEQLTATDHPTLCPKHVLMQQEEQERFSRMGKKSTARRKYRREQAELLKSSPLRAYNPKFDESHA